MQLCKRNIIFCAAGSHISLEWSGTNFRVGRGQDATCKILFSCSLYGPFLGVIIQTSKYYSGSTAGLPDTGCDPDFVVLAPFFLSIGYSWLREVRMHMELVNITYGCIWNINHTSMQNWISTSIKSIISEVFSLHGRS